MTTDEIKALVISKANQYGINPNVALAQIGRESSFNPRAVGSSGERGLGQFMPGTWVRFSSAPFDQAFDPETNLDAWGRYMTHLSTLFGGDYPSMLIGYNGGEGHLLDPKKHGPPSQAAQDYAQQILAQAGAGSPDLRIVVEPPGDESNWLMYAGLGLLGVLLWQAISD